MNVVEGDLDRHGSSSVLCFVRWVTCKLNTKVSIVLVNWSHVNYFSRSLADNEHRNTCAKFWREVDTLMGRMSNDSPVHFLHRFDLLDGYLLGLISVGCNCYLIKSRPK